MTDETPKDNQTRTTPQNDIKGEEVIAEADETEKVDWLEKAIEREAIPKTSRKDTVAEFAKKYGISEETYYYHLRKKENKARIVNIWLNEALNGGNEVLQKLKDNALEGKEKSIEMYLKFVLELAENLDVKSGGHKIAIQIINSIAEKNGITDTSTGNDS